MSKNKSGITLVKTTKEGDKEVSDSLNSLPDGRSIIVALGMSVNDATESIVGYFGESFCTFKSHPIYARDSKMVEYVIRQVIVENLKDIIVLDVSVLNDDRVDLLSMGCDQATPVFKLYPWGKFRTHLGEIFYDLRLDGETNVIRKQIFGV